MVVASGQVDSPAVAVNPPDPKPPPSGQVDSPAVAVISVVAEASTSVVAEALVAATSVAVAATSRVRTLLPRA